MVVDQGVGLRPRQEAALQRQGMDLTDNNKHSKFYGRTYLTWTQFESHNGEFVASPILESHCDDGGKHWSKAQEISGKNKDLCTFQTDGHDGQCDEGTGLDVDRRARRNGLRRVLRTARTSRSGSPARSFDNQYLARQVEGRRRALVEADVRRRPRGRVERLPAQRRRPADAQRLPGARLVARQHRREPERRDALPHVLGQPQRHPRRRESRRRTPTCS